MVLIRYAHQIVSERVCGGRTSDISNFVIVGAACEVKLTTLEVMLFLILQISQLGAMEA